jgi:pre-mRNA-processing factor SLU7
MTHKRKDCLERPRKIAAKYGGGRIAPDEAIQPNLELDFEAKRDRWNGYDSTQYSQVVQEYADVEEMKRRLKAEKLKKEMMDGEREEVSHA